MWQVWKFNLRHHRQHRIVCQSDNEKGSVPRLTWDRAQRPSAQAATVAIRAQLRTYSTIQGRGAPSPRPRWPVPGSIGCRRQVSNGAFSSCYLPIKADDIWRSNLQSTGGPRRVCSRNSRHFGADPSSSGRVGRACVVHSGATGGVTPAPKSGRTCRRQSGRLAPRRQKRETLLAWSDPGSSIRMRPGFCIPRAAEKKWGLLMHNVLLNRTTCARTATAPGSRTVESLAFQHYLFSPAGPPRRATTTSGMCRRSGVPWATARLAAAPSSITALTSAEGTH